jgi:hypothetical protein
MGEIGLGRSVAGDLRREQQRVVGQVEARQLVVADVKML